MRIPAIVYVLALGAFALITTELGVIGILPQVSEAFGITIDRAGWLLSGFALVIALLGPWMTLLFSKVNRKFSLCFVLSVFFIANVASIFAPNFGILLLTRILPAFVHPVFWSMAMSVSPGLLWYRSPRADRFLRCRRGWMGGRIYRLFGAKCRRPSCAPYPPAVDASYSQVIFRKSARCPPQPIF